MRVMRMVALWALLGAALGAELNLPAPRTQGGKPLMEALRLRRTVRDFSAKPLPPQVISDLLWAAFGLNRADGGRTAPSAWNQQEIDIYVFTQDGFFFFDAKPHRLLPLLSGDRRAWTGADEFARAAPLTLVFVADLVKAEKSEAEDRLFYAYADAGYISQNVYLFCASEGLGTVVHDAAEKAELARKMQLRPHQRILLSQAVGYPK
jgi:nitroreductase